MFLLAAGIFAATGWVFVNKPTYTKLSAEELAPAAIKERIRQSQAAGKKKDFKTAAEYLLPLAQNGILEAQFRLGIVYGSDAVYSQLNNGQGQLGSALEDHENAGKWLSSAAEQGHVPAQAALGTHYCWGVASNEMTRKLSPEGVSWLEKAAKAGEVSAMTGLATTYEQGICTQRNATEAAKWHLQAAEHGIEWSLLSLSHMSREGRGMPKDPLQSKVWLILGGYDKDHEIINKLSPRDRAEVERRVLEWQERHPGPKR